MKLFQKIALFTICLAACVLCPFAMNAQTISTPADFMSEEATKGIMSAVTFLLTYLSGRLPILKNIPEVRLRAIASAFLVVAGFATFKVGFFSLDTLKYVLDNIFPIFGFSGGVYALIQLIFGKKQVKSLPAEG